MLYASSISGLTLANAGLGSVHGLAAPIGACFPMPHGEVCGSLLFEATQLNISLMQSREPANIGLQKYAEAGRALCGDQSLDDQHARSALLQLLQEWTHIFTMPALSDYGMLEADIEKVIRHASSGSMQANPIRLTDTEVAGLIRSRLSEPEL